MNGDITPPPALDERIFSGWHTRIESCEGEISTYRYSIVGAAGDLLATPERSTGDPRRGDDGKRLDLVYRAPDLYRHLCAAVMALRSYQFGNSSPDLAEEVADSAGSALAIARGDMPR